VNKCINKNNSKFSEITFESTKSFEKPNYTCKRGIHQREVPTQHSFFDAMVRCP
jgi:hypothetical protein